MYLSLHQTHHIIGDFDNILKGLKSTFDDPQIAGIHMFPELFLCGYPLQDLCLQRPFIVNYLRFLEQLNAWSVNELKGQSDLALLLGGLEYEFDDKGLPLTIKNVIYLVKPGQKLTSIYTKKLLPNYDIFDEEKYFTPGNQTVVWEHQGFKIGLLICEDMWSSSTHPTDPVLELYNKCNDEKIKLDLILNLSASPFHIGKREKRLERGREIISLFECPFAYVNQVGGEDEILFDGESFYCDTQGISKTAKTFKADIITVQINKSPVIGDKLKNIEPKKANTWEALFEPRIQKGAKGPVLVKMSDADLELTVDAMIFGLREYARKTGLQNFLVALSGGMDSALVLTLAQLAVDPNHKVEALFMPGLYTATESYDLSQELCKNLNIPLRSLPIKFFHSSIKNSFVDSFGTPLEGLGNENIQSRLRGALLYTRSNQTGAMVINTSNKSEISVGYSTMYGDSVGAISLLGDLYKSEVFDIARFVNKKYGKLIPEGIITRPPSAELRENQKDSDSLPPYDQLDVILEGLLSYRLGPSEFTELGFDPATVERVSKLYQNSEFKRKQFAPIIKLMPKSFGFGYRLPVTKKFQSIFP